MFFEGGDKGKGKKKGKKGEGLEVKKPKKVVRTEEDLAELARQRREEANKKFEAAMKEKAEKVQRERAIEQHLNDTATFLQRKRRAQIRNRIAMREKWEYDAKAKVLALKVIKTWKNYWKSYTKWVKAATERRLLAGKTPYGTIRYDPMKPDVEEHPRGYQFHPDTKTTLAEVPSVQAGHSLLVDGITVGISLTSTHCAFIEGETRVDELRETCCFGGNPSGGTWWDGLWRQSYENIDWNPLFLREDHKVTVMGEDDYLYLFVNGVLKAAKPLRKKVGKHPDHFLGGDGVVGNMDNWDPAEGKNLYKPEGLPCVPVDVLGEDRLYPVIDLGGSINKITLTVPP